MTVEISPASEVDIEQAHLQQDRILVQAAVEGDAGAMEELYRTYYPHVFRTISYGLEAQGNAHAEDLAQDVMVKVLCGALPRIHETGLKRSIGGYFKMAAQNRLIDQVRRIQLREEVAIEVYTANGQEVLSPQPTPEEVRIHSSQLEYVLSVLREHTDPLTTQAILSYAQGQTYQEIAQQQGIAPNQVRTRIRRGRLMLRRLSNSGIIEAPLDATFNLR